MGNLGQSGTRHYAATDSAVKIRKVLGQDDWLVYARTTTGVLVFTVIETDGRWFDAPNMGLAEYGSAEWRVDNSWMHAYIAGHTGAYDWEECGTDTDGTALDWPESHDEEFMRNSRRNYLCD